MEEQDQEALYRFALKTDATAPREHCLPGDGWGAWIVLGSKPGTEYKVSLACLPDRDGHLNGACSCPDFEHRCLANFRESHQVTPNYYPADQRTECRHIAIAKKEAYRLILWRGLLSEAQASPPPETKPSMTPIDPPIQNYETS